MGLIKKTIQCIKCKNYNSYLIEEKATYVGITVKCKHCGTKQTCTKQKNHITKWEEVKQCMK